MTGRQAAKSKRQTARVLQAKVSPACRAPHAARRQEGFTLLEIMIALAIVAIALITLLGLGNRSIDVHARLQHITRATLLAQEKMTEIEIQARNKILEMQDQDGAFEPPFDAYRWRVTYEETPLPAIQTVTVVVAWGEEARNEAVDITSFVYR